MTKREMVQMGMEFKRNYYGKYHVEVEKTYKYRGEVKTCTELVLTEEGKKIMEELETPMFICPNCGEKVSFNELEIWGEETEEELMNNKVVCSVCYEEEMGEDLQVFFFYTRITNVYSYTARG